MNLEDAFVKGWGRAPSPSEREGFNRLSKVFRTHEYEDLILISMVLFEVQREQFGELARGAIHESLAPVASQCVDSVNTAIRAGLGEIAPQSASATRRAVAAELKESLLRVEARADRARSVEEHRLPLVETWIGYSLVIGLICRQIGYGWQTGLVFAAVTGGLVVSARFVQWVCSACDAGDRTRTIQTSAPAATRSSLRRACRPCNAERG